MTTPGNEILRLIKELSAHFLTRPEGVTACRVYNSSAVSVNNGAWTAITFNSERYDPAGLHSTSVNTSRITIATPGFYLVGGTVEWSASVGGALRAIALAINGTYFADVRQTPTGGGHVTTQSISSGYAVNAGDYFELHGYQDSGGALNATVAGNKSPEFWAARIA